jgi:prophage regulatory protein
MDWLGGDICAGQSELIFNIDFQLHIPSREIEAYDAFRMLAAAAIANADQPVHRTILRLREVIHRTGVGKSTIYDRIKRGQFPPQRKLLEGSDSVGWYEDEIDAYVNSDRAGRPHSQLSTAAAANARTLDARTLRCRSTMAPISPPKKQSKDGRRSQMKSSHHKSLA